MKLLLDENLPRQLKKDLADHMAYTAVEMGWNGKDNGELLSLLIENNFEVLLTGDKNLQHQQNFQAYPIPVLVLNALFINYPSLKPLVPKILEALETELPPGPTIIKPI